MRSHLLRQSLGAVSGLMLLAGFTASARAESIANAPALPTISIGTAGVVAADALPPVPATASDATPTATITAASAQPKPAATRRPHHTRMQTIDTASLSEPASPGLVGNGLVGNTLIGHARVIEARATALRPAPLPDQDVDAPGPDAQTLAAQQETSVTPSVYGNKDHFSGDGFSAGSNLESDKNNRRKPGGGMSLSIPVQ